MTPEERAEDIINRCWYNEIAWAIDHSVAKAVAEEREALARSLEASADQYEKDGEPGELGYNCWGWRDIARILRERAAAIRARGLETMTSGAESG